MNEFKETIITNYKRTKASKDYVKESITENDIDTMNSMEKLKYIENSYDRFMGNAVEYNNKEEYTNQNNNVKITFMEK